jgi:hypothetical protein
MKTSVSLFTSSGGSWQNQSESEFPELKNFQNETPTHSANSKIL